jgi:hypothetical protein
MRSRIDEVERAIARNAELLADIRGQLHRMPDSRRNTRWHDDRCRARQQLLLQRDELHAEQLKLAMV